MQIRTILYHYIKTVIKHVFLLNFTYELLMILEMPFLAFWGTEFYRIPKVVKYVEAMIFS